MKMNYFGLFVLSCLVLASCQKEIDWNPGGGGGGGGSTSGDQLVKALQITPATNDTNTITFSYDANKRLLVYNTTGKVNGILTNIKYVITRLGDGKISKILSTSSLTAGFIDSIVYVPTYTASGSRLSFVIGTQYTAFFNLRDSTAFVYNAGGQVISKETFTDIFGSMTASFKETYVYDAAGNVSTTTTYAPNGTGGYNIAGTTTHTFDAHKSAVVLGDESFIVLPAANISKNNYTKQVTNAVGGTSYTATVSQLQFNSFDRPTQSSMNITPQPPGYDLKLLYYYQ